MRPRLATKAAKGLARSESGASTVELAIVAPVLILLFMGVVVLGQWMFFGILAANAARAGTDYGEQNLTTAADGAGMTNAALQDGQNLSQFSATPHCYYISGSTTTPCATPPASATPAPGSVYYVEVDTTGKFKPLITYPGIPSSVTVSGKSVTRVISQ